MNGGSNRNYCHACGSSALPKNAWILSATCGLCGTGPFDLCINCLDKSRNGLTLAPRSLCACARVYRPAGPALSFPSINQFPRCEYVPTGGAPHPYRPEWWGSSAQPENLGAQKVPVEDLADDFDSCETESASEEEGLGSMKELRYRCQGLHWSTIMEARPLTITRSEPGYCVPGVYQRLRPRETLKKPIRFGFDDFVARR